MIGGMTTGEELDLALAEIGRQRQALDIALRGLAAARDAGFAGADRFIAEVNEALAVRQRPIQPVLPPHVTAWLKGLFRR